MSDVVYQESFLFFFTQRYQKSDLHIGHYQPTWLFVGYSLPHFPIHSSEKRSLRRPSHTRLIIFICEWSEIISSLSFFNPLTLIRSLSAVSLSIKWVFFLSLKSVSAQKWRSISETKGIRKSYCHFLLTLSRAGASNFLTAAWANLYMITCTSRPGKLAAQIMDNEQNGD